MKKVSYVFLLLFFGIYSCKNVSLTERNQNTSIYELLSEVGKVDTINILDLSNRGLTRIPDLSSYKIKKLIISNNKLIHLDFKNLPKYLVELDASNNRIKGVLNFISTKNERGVLKNNVSKNIRIIDLSNNKIEGVSFYLYDSDIDKIDLSSNDLDRLYLYLNNKRINYLNISNNKYFSNIVSFDPKCIDSLIYKDIMINAPLRLGKLDIILPPSKN